MNGGQHGECTGVLGSQQTPFALFCLGRIARSRYGCQAVSMLATASRPISAMAISRIRYFWIFPEMVMG